MLRHFLWGIQSTLNWSVFSSWSWRWKIQFFSWPERSGTSVKAHKWGKWRHRHCLLVREWCGIWVKRHTNRTSLILFIFQPLWNWGKYCFPQSTKHSKIRACRKLLGIVVGEDFYKVWVREDECSFIQQIFVEYQCYARYEEKVLRMKIRHILYQ